MLAAMHTPILTYAPPGQGRGVWYKGVKLSMGNGEERCCNISFSLAIYILIGSKLN